MLIDYDLGVHFTPENEKEFIEGINQFFEKDKGAWDFTRFLNDYDRSKLAMDMLEMLEEK